jgi:tetratricopeptide (TPR) repeat protein
MSTKNQPFRYFLLAIACIVPGDLCRAQRSEPPQITAIEPNSAITTPGAKIMVLGTHLSPGSTIYFGGLQAREITFINASAIQAVTPYLRPGTYELDLKSGEAIIHSEVSFTALPAPVDSTIDQAELLAAKKQTGAAISILASIAATHTDYDVRAYAHYRVGQLYLALGDYWRGAGEAGLIWDAKVSMGVQTFWRYRLLYDETAYALSESNDHETDPRLADGSVQMNVTDNPEPRFWRCLINARFGKMEQAKADLKFILAAEPENPSYRALAAYIGVLAGDKTQLEAFRGRQVGDVRALGLLGQAAYISGDYDGAQGWWAAAGKISVAEAKLDCWAGRKHVKFGQARVGTALIAECATVAPDSREGKEAKEQLADLSSQH